MLRGIFSIRQQARLLIRLLRSANCLYHLERLSITTPTAWGSLSTSSNMAFPLCAPQVSALTNMAELVGASDNLVFRLRVFFLSGSFHKPSQHRT